MLGVVEGFFVLAVAVVTDDALAALLLSPAMKSGRPEKREGSGVFNSHSFISFSRVNASR